MKKLLVLLLIWLGFTIDLAYFKYKSIDYMEGDLQRRAYLVYARTFNGCMIGASFADNDYDFVHTYSYCRTLAFDEKDRYLGK